MRDEFVKFLETPTRDTFLAVRNALISAETYDPYSDELNNVEDLLDEERWTEAQEVLGNTMSNLLLTPRAHLYASYAAEKSGDDQLAELETAIAAVCAEGILATGNGSEESPYLVTRVIDEYDVLQFLDKEMKHQAFVEKDGRHFDRIDCTDDSVVWFDITDSFQNLESRMEE